MTEREKELRRHQVSCIHPVYRSSARGPIIDSKLSEKITVQSHAHTYTHGIDHLLRRGFNFDCVYVYILTFCLSFLILFPSLFSKKTKQKSFSFRFKSESEIVLISRKVFEIRVKGIVEKESHLGETAQESVIKSLSSFFSHGTHTQTDYRSPAPSSLLPESNEHKYTQKQTFQ
jgi:hypothetical protein